MAVTAKLVKELRDKTGAGMMDCKKALTETGGNVEEALDWLRKKGIASASKKSGRVAAQGKVMTATNGLRGAILEVNAETDFASKNEKFVDFAEKSVQVALEQAPADIEAFGAMTYPDSGLSMADELTNQIASIGENMNLRRVQILEVSSGTVASYIHMGGKIGVLVSLESPSDDQDALQALAKKLAMHVAAANPPYLNRDSVPAEDLEREKAVLTDQAKASGKPDNIIEKMVMGRLNKFYGENCLLDQEYVVDPDQKVGKVVTAAAKEIGSKITVTGYVRFALGEGIEKKQENFADEVNAQINNP